jgi:hypothetical protein
MTAGWRRDSEEPYENTSPSTFANRASSRSTPSADDLSDPRVGVCGAGLFQHGLQEICTSKNIAGLARA